jgi:hypothetical protein
MAAISSSTGRSSIFAIAISSVNPIIDLVCASGRLPAEIVKCPCHAGVNHRALSTIVPSQSNRTQFHSRLVACRLVKSEQVPACTICGGSGAVTESLPPSGMRHGYMPREQVQPLLHATGKFPVLVMVVIFRDHPGSDDPGAGSEYATDACGRCRARAPARHRFCAAFSMIR